MPIIITPAISLPDDALEESFVRGAGPGGQNVNKVATAVELRFDLRRSTLPEDVKMRLRLQERGRLTVDDVLLVDAREHRTQAMNREAARARLADMVRRALIRPKARRATRPPKASKVRRLEGKARRAEVKAGRGRRRGDE